MRSLKAKVQHEKGIPIEKQRLFYQGIELRDDCRVKDYGIELYDSIKLKLREDGDGPKATKKRARE